MPGREDYVLSNRELEWVKFSEIVREHVTGYTVPQYGDYPGDQVTDYSEEECVRQIMKYCARYGRGARGPEQEKLDIKKMAHYAAILWFKRLARTDEAA